MPAQKTHPYRMPIFWRGRRVGIFTKLPLTSLVCCPKGHGEMPIGQEAQVCDSWGGEGSCFQGHWPAHQGLLNTKSATMRMCLEQAEGRWLPAQSSSEKCSTRKKIYPRRQWRRHPGVQLCPLSGQGGSDATHPCGTAIPLYSHSYLLINTFVILHGVIIRS